MSVRAFCLAALLVAPTFAFAAGGDDDTPPAPTSTTTECPEGSVYDENADACVIIQDSGLSDDALYGAARELAYFGRHNDALAVLAEMSDPDDTRVQTYLGFVHRQLGDHDRATTHYAAALTADPDNVLARSYLGMAHVAADRLDLARAELQQIRARGAAGTWPDRALSRAIRTGVTVDY